MDEPTAENVTITDEPIKTATDLEIEKLRAEIDSLKAEYANELKEAREANRQLWAQLHPVEGSRIESATAEEQPSQDAAMAAFKKAIGIN